MLLLAAGFTWHWNMGWWWHKKCCNVFPIFPHLSPKSHPCAIILTDWGRTKHPWRYRHKDWNMNKKLISTILLFAVFIGFLWWGLAMLFSPGKDVETVIYSLLLLVCAGYALVSLLMLPRKKLP